MWHTQKETKIHLDEAETHVALGFLSDEETFELLINQWTSNAILRNLHRANLLEERPADTSPEAINALIRIYTPKLFSYQLPYTHKAPLLDAYELGSTGQAPSRTGFLEKIPTEKILEISQATRDWLSALD